MGLTKIDLRRIYLREEGIETLIRENLNGYIYWLENQLMKTDLVNKNGILQLVSFSATDNCPLCLSKEHEYSKKHSICLNPKCPFYLGET